MLYISWSFPCSVGLQSAGRLACSSSCGSRRSIPGSDDAFQKCLSLCPVFLVLHSKSIIRASNGVSRNGSCSQSVNVPCYRPTVYTAPKQAGQVIEYCGKRPKVYSRLFAGRNPECRLGWSCAYLLSAWYMKPVVSSWAGLANERGDEIDAWRDASWDYCVSDTVSWCLVSVRQYYVVTCKYKGAFPGFHCW